MVGYCRLVGKCVCTLILMVTGIPERSRSCLVMCLWFWVWVFWVKFNLRLTGVKRKFLWMVGNFRVWTWHVHMQTHVFILFRCLFTIPFRVWKFAIFPVLKKSSLSRLKLPKLRPLQRVCKVVWVMIVFSAVGSCLEAVQTSVCVAKITHLRVLKTSKLVMKKWLFRHVYMTKRHVVLSWFLCKPLHVLERLATTNIVAFCKHKTWWTHQAAKLNMCVISHIVHHMEVMGIVRELLGSTLGLQQNS
jgi:hypothetical protein